ncbi:MAG: M20/M25/M40 family metallo-hydrolase [Lentimicrobiaceae bacterium]|jgi:hypothetical protein|nr:M20/M25/M40 family metallo-hydrolase [Lentimicrobiaceae bacterium]
MNCKLFVFLYFIISVCFASAQTNIRETDIIEKQMQYLASDMLEGRAIGSKGDSLTRDYIRNIFEQYDLTFIDPSGLQLFDLTTSIKLGENVFFRVGNQSAICDTDFTVYAFSGNKQVTAEGVFIGFGLVIDTENFSRNDYAGKNVKDKWVVMLDANPVIKDTTAQISFPEIRSKALTARDKGALGVVVVNTAANNRHDELSSLHFEHTHANVGIPVINLTRQWADNYLFTGEFTTDSLETLITLENHVDVLLPQITALTEIVKINTSTSNVVGILAGDDPKLKNEFIVVGAHYDHLGYGGTGSGSRTPDTVAIHYGADDNASGVVGMIELGRRFAWSKSQPKRSIIFVAFGSEEVGLLGSKYFVQQALHDSMNIKAMINFDMIGRLNDKKTITIGGSGTAVESEVLLEKIGKNHDLSLAFSPEGYGPSDHASFYAENIPVFYISTGAHTDYHTPNDTWDKINYDGMLEIINFTEDLLIELTNGKQLTFQEAGPTNQSTHANLKITLGIMPDFSDSGNNGLGVGGVSKGKAAERAGILKGDKITAINGMSISNIYDYMDRMKQFKSGDCISVDILRKEEPLVIIVNL